MYYDFHLEKKKGKTCKVVWFFYVYIFLFCGELKDRVGLPLNPTVFSFLVSKENSWHDGNELYSQEKVEYELDGKLELQQVGYQNSQNPFQLYMYYHCYQLYSQNTNYMFYQARATAGSIFCSHEK